MNMILGLILIAAVVALLVALIFLPFRKHPLSRAELMEIYNEGYDQGIATVVGLLESVAKISDDPDQAMRHAALIRQLKRGGSK